MSIDEFWEAFRDHQVAVRVNTIDQRSVVTELAQEHGCYIGVQEYSIHQYPWVVYWHGDVTGWTGQPSSILHPEMLLEYDEFQDIMDGDGEVNLSASDLEAIL
nr:MAG TPA: hypothetical protein [Caudoviricetes sp.]